MTVESRDSVPPAAETGKVRHLSIQVDGVRIFYREAGEAGRDDVPAILLLHGFPSSSHMFRDLLPALAGEYRVVAPDYPGFGYSAFPDPEQFDYTFESFAGVIEAFTHEIGLHQYALYMQDYGAPVGLRLALAAPQRVTGLIIQNGNAYEEGLSEEVAPLRAYWRTPTAANR